MKKYLSVHVKEYDVVYISIPANDIAAMTTDMCKKNNVPVVVDIEDLWPEAMSMVIKNDWLRKLLLYSFAKDAEKTYRNADGIIGTSDDYTNRAFRRRKRNIPAETVYVGCNLKDFDDGVEKYSAEIEKKEGEFWVTYAGSISTSYDIKTLIDAGYSLRNRGVQVQILGTGSLKEKLEVYSRDMENIHFWGFTAYPKMAAALNKSDVVVNSFVRGAPQSIVNKIGDYLASGKPMINTLENPLFCKMVGENDIGTNVEPGNIQKLVEVIEKYMDGDGGQGKNARELAEKKFDRAVSYLKIVGIVNRVAKQKQMWGIGNGREKSVDIGDCSGI
ncbi:MAG: glycosyltransferase [Eubacterium sp.]|nr:glycosyltransferase [Eubacterium sp.]